MTTIITRYYGALEQADAAMAQLEEEGLARVHMDRFVAVEGVADAIVTAGVNPSSAGAFAERLAQGGALVVVRAPFGQALWASDILDAHGPIDAGVENVNLYVESTPSHPQRYNNYLPVLLDSDALILSGPSFPAIAKSWSFSGMLGLPMLSKSQAPKAKLISGSTTPFSSALGLPLLTKERESA
ncbi:hypothetical protein [Alsobacter sp. R-9]